MMPEKIMNPGKLRRRVRASTEKGWIRVSTGKGRIPASAGKVEIWENVGKVESRRIPKKGRNPGEYRKSGIRASTGEG